MHSHKRELVLDPRGLWHWRYTRPNGLQRASTRTFQTEAAAVEVALRPGYVRRTRIPRHVQPQVLMQDPAPESTHAARPRVGIRRYIKSGQRATTHVTYSPQRAP